MTSRQDDWAGRLRERAEGLLVALARVSAEAAPHGLTRAQLAAMIDHTVLKPEATPEMIDQACAEAREHGFSAVCVNPCYVARCARLLEGAASAVCSVVGFPLGASVSAVKAYEAERAIADGAREIDMVIQIGALKAGDYFFSCGVADHGDELHLLQCRSDMIHLVVQSDRVCSGVADLEITLSQMDQSALLEEACHRFTQ